MTPAKDPSLNLLIGIVAKRLDCTAAAATGIVGILSEDDRSDLIRASRNYEHGGTVAIAAIVHRARQRKIQAMPPGRAKDMAQQMALCEANRHRRVIELLPLPDCGCKEKCRARAGGRPVYPQPAETVEAD